MSVRKLNQVKKDQFVTLKVFVHNQTKVFNFDISQTVEVVSQTIYDSSPPEITNIPISDYGLFIPNQRGRKPRWLTKTMTLDQADVTANDALEFKQKVRPLRVMTIDGNEKVVRIDDSACVRDIADAVGDKMGIRSLEEFSLRKRTPVGMSKAPKWLFENMTLHEQDITADETLEYAKKYYYGDDRVDQEDPFTLHLLYFDAQQSILTGRYPCSKQSMIEFAGLQMQIQFGDHKPSVHNEKFFDKKKFIPANYLKEDKKNTLMNEIIQQHKRFVGLKETNAKYRYVTKVRSLSTYGITFFECTQTIEKKGEKGKNKEEIIPFLLGVSRSSIIKMDSESQKELNNWNIEYIKRWSQTKGTFSIDFGDWESEYFNFQTTESEALSALIFGYIDIILKSRNDVGNVRPDDDYYDTADVENIKPIFGFAGDGISSSYTPGYSVSSNIPLHQSNGQFQNFHYPEFNRLVSQDTKELFGKKRLPNSSVSLEGKELDAKSFGGRSQLDGNEHEPRRRTVAENPLNVSYPDPRLRDQLIRVVEAMDQVVDTMGQNNQATIYDQYKTFLDAELQELFKCLESAIEDEKNPNVVSSMSNLIRATKPITDCIGDILELISESEQVLIDTYREDIMDQIKCYWNAAKNAAFNNPLLVDSPTAELIGVASVQVTDKFNHLLEEMEKILSLPQEDNLLLSETSYMLQEIGKAKLMNKLLACNNLRLDSYFLDPDVHAGFVQLEEVIEHTKNNIVDYFERSPINDGNNNIKEESEVIDVQLNNLKLVVAAADPDEDEDPNESAAARANFKLRMAGKINAASIMKLLNASELALTKCNDPNTKAELTAAVQKGNASLMELFFVLNQPDAADQNILLEANKKHIPVFTDLTRIAKKAVPTITDLNLKNDLNAACIKANRDLGVLFTSVQAVYNLSLSEEMAKPKVEVVPQERTFVKKPTQPKPVVNIEIQSAHQNIERFKQILESSNASRLQAAKQDPDAMFQTVNRRRQMNFKVATESLVNSLKSVNTTTNQLTSTAQKNPAGCNVVVKMLTSTVEQCLQHAAAAAASTDAPVSTQIIESARFIAVSVQDLLKATEVEINNKSPESAEDLNQKKLVINDAILQLNRLLGSSTEIRLPEVESSLSSIQESIDSFDLTSAGKVHFTGNEPVCEYATELKQLAGIISGITKASRSSSINHGKSSKDAANIIKKLLVSAAKVECNSIYSSLMSDRDSLFQLFDQISVSKDQTVILENMKKVNLIVAKLINFAKETATKEAKDKNKQMNLVRQIQNLMNAVTALVQAAKNCISTQGNFIDVSPIKGTVDELVNTLLYGNPTTSVTDDDILVEISLARDVSNATKLLAQKSHEMIASSIKVAQNPSDSAVNQKFEINTKEVINALLELRKLSSNLDSGGKECGKAINKIQTETGYILNDPRFTVDPKLYAHLIEDTPEKREQAATSHLKASNVLLQIEKDLQQLNNNLLQTDQISESNQPTDIKALATSLGNSVPALVVQINEVISSQGDSNFRKNLVQNTKQLVQISTQLLKDSQNTKPSPEDIQRIASLTARSQESIGIINSELKISSQIIGEIEKEAQLIKNAKEKLFQPIQLVQMPKPGQPQQQRVQGSPQMIRPVNAGPQQGQPQQGHPQQGPQGPQQGLNSNRPSTQGGPQGTPSQRMNGPQGPQQGHPQQRPPQQGHPQQGPQGPQQGHPQQRPPQQGHPQQGHPQQGHPQQRPPQQGHPQQGHPQQGNSQQRPPQQGHPQQGHPQQGLNSNRPSTQGGPQGTPSQRMNGPPQGIQTLQRMQHPVSKLKAPSNFYEWRNVLVNGTKELIKSVTFLQNLDKRNTDSVTFAVRKIKATLVSLVESSRQLATYMKNEEDKKTLLNNANTLCTVVEIIFQDLRQASLGYDMNERINDGLTNINTSITSLIATVNKGEPEKPKDEVEVIPPEDLSEFNEIMNFIKSKVAAFLQDTKPTRSRDTCDDLFTTTKLFVKLLSKILYSGKKELLDLARDTKDIHEKLLNQAVSFIAFYASSPLIQEFKNSVGTSITSLCSILEFIRDQTNNERKEIEKKIDDNNKMVQAIIALIIKISPKFSQENADAERKMAEENARMLSNVGGKSYADLRMEEELRQEREHQIRVLKLEKELQKQKDRIAANNRLKFEQGQM